MKNTMSALNAWIEKNIGWQNMPSAIAWCDEQSNEWNTLIQGLENNLKLVKGSVSTFQDVDQWYVPKMKALLEKYIAHTNAYEQTPLFEQFEKGMK